MVCRYLLPAGKRQGAEWVCGDLAGSPGRSLSVNLRKGVWKDFAMGQGGGDLISLWAAVHGISQGQAKREAEAWLGLPPADNVVPFHDPRRPNVRFTDYERIDTDDEGIDPQAGFETDHDPFSGLGGVPDEDEDSQWYRHPDVRPTHIWDYRSIDGELVAQVYRFVHPVTGHKAIRPWNPKTGWWEAPKLEGGEKRPLLYLLEFARACNEQPIAICEGEKAADAVRAVGWLATTCMGGAQAVALTDWTPLAGRHVILWRDKDRGGRLHQTKLMHILRNAGVASCRLVELPLDKPVGWDAADAGEEERKALLEKALASEPVFLAEPPPSSDDDINPIDWQSLEGQAPPQREFVVDGWLPTGCATSLYGTGGVGKSFLAQLLGTCVAGGKPFLGLPTMQAPVLAVFCEDDDEELWRRQVRINGMMELRMTDLAGFMAQGRLGMSNLLMTFPKGKLPEFQPILQVIEGKAGEIGTKLVILDNVAQMFGGEENSRADVTAFINAVNGMARRLGAAVLQLGHPPKSEADYSGSTAWLAAVRCMWTLKAVKQEGDQGETFDGLELTRSKANYAPTGAQIRLRWVDGVLRREEEAPMSGLDLLAHHAEAKAAFLAALDELITQQRNVSHSPRAANYAPKAMKAAGLAGGFSYKDLERAMNELFGEKIIKANQSLWRGPDRKWVQGIARWPTECSKEQAESDAEPDGKADAPGSDGDGSRSRKVGS